MKATTNTTGTTRTMSNTGGLESLVGTFKAVVNATAYVTVGTLNTANNVTKGAYIAMSNSEITGINNLVKQSPAFHTRLAVDQTNEVCDKAVVAMANVLDGFKLSDFTGEVKKAATTAKDAVVDSIGPKEVK